MRAWYPWAVPGSQNGAWAARPSTTGSQRAQLVDRQQLVEADEPGAMAEQPADGDGLLAGGGELGPVGGDGLVEVELAALDEQMGDGGDDALGRREHELQPVRVVGTGALGVGAARPQVDHPLAVVVHGDRRADLAVLVEVADEGVADAFEPGGDGPVDLDAHAVLPSARRCRRRRASEEPNPASRGGMAGTERPSPTTSHPTDVATPCRGGMIDGRDRPSSRRRPRRCGAVTEAAPDLYELARAHAWGHFSPPVRRRADRS